MLVLSRKKGEEIIIGNNIRVTVLHLTHGRVRLKITAPKETVVMRREIIEKAKPT